MAEVTEDFVNTLKSVRGEFQNSKGGRIGNRVLAHVFSTVFPVFFFGYLILWGDLQWPPTSEHWLFLVFGTAALFVGMVIHRTINNRYIFDDDGIREYRQNGQLKASIRWNELVRIEYRESRGIKSFSLITESGVMHLELYKSLNDALRRLEAR